MLGLLNKEHNKIILSVIIFILIVIVLNSNFVSLIIWKLPELFVDFKGSIKWLECKSLNYNLFSDNLKNCTNIPFNYGKIFLILPYNKFLDSFYTNYLPFCLIFFSIYFITKIFKLSDLKNLCIYLLAIFSPISLLLFERANFDLIIFVCAMFIVFNKIYILNWTISFLLMFTKVYPAILLIGVFIENSKRRIKHVFVILFGILVCSAIYLAFNINEYLFLFNNLSVAKAGYHFLFSLNSLAKILKYTFNFNYIVLLVIFYSLFIIFIIKFYKNFSANMGKNFDSNELYNVDNKLFFICSYLSIFCFFIYSNYIYREIFIIGCIPLILSLENKNKGILIKIMIYLIFVRYIYSYIYGYYNVNDGITFDEGQRVFSAYFLLVITIKSILDFLFMSLLAGLTILQTKFYIKNVYLQKLVK